MPEIEQAPIGHNEGEPLDDLFETLRARTDEITATGNRWITERPEITNADQAGAATVFVKQVNAHKKSVELVRKGRNGPHRNAIKDNDTRFHALVRSLDIAATEVKRTLGAYLSKMDAIAAEERRKAEAEALAKIEAAEAAKIAAESRDGDVIGNAVRAEVAEAEAEAATKAATEAAKPVAVRSDTGQTASVTKRTVVEIVDRRILMTIARDVLAYMDDETILKALRKMVKDMDKPRFDDIPGARIFQTTSAVVR